MEAEQETVFLERGLLEWSEVKPGCMREGDKMTGVDTKGGVGVWQRWLAQAQVITGDTGCFLSPRMAAAPALKVATAKRR
jgi:hypothetical protein